MTQNELLIAVEDGDIVVGDLAPSAVHRSLFEPDVVLVVGDASDQLRRRRRSMPPAPALRAITELAADRMFCVER